MPIAAAGKEAFDDWAMMVRPNTGNCSKTPSLIAWAKRHLDSAAASASSGTSADCASAGVLLCAPQLSPSFSGAELLAHPMFF